MCRAWVRVTLNEGLFPSYVDAIVGQYNNDDLLHMRLMPEKKNAGLPRLHFLA